MFLVVLLVRLISSPYSDLKIFLNSRRQMLSGILQWVYRGALAAYFSGRTQALYYVFVGIYWIAVYGNILPL